MDQVIEFLSKYALWIGVAGIVSLMALIGFLFDSRKAKKLKEEKQDELGEPDAIITSDTVNILDKAAVVAVPTTEVVATPAVAATVTGEPTLEVVTNDTPVIEVPEVEVTTPEVVETQEVTTPLVDEVPSTNMPDMSAFAYNATPSEIPAVVSDETQIIEPVVTAPEVVEPVLEEAPVTEPSVPNMDEFSYSTPVMEEPVAEEAPVTEPIVPNMDEFSYSAPVVETTPEIIEPVATSLEVTADISPIVEAVTPTVEMEEIPVAEAPAVANMPDMGAFAYTPPVMEETVTSEPQIESPADAEPVMPDENTKNVVL